MPETIQSFLGKVKDAATALGDQETIELVSAVQQQTNASKLRILLVGSPGSGRFSLANVLVGQPGLLPTSPIPKAPIRITMSYGEVGMVNVLASDGISTTMPLAGLRSFLTSSDTARRRYDSLEIKTTTDLFKTSDLVLETIGEQHSRAEWKELLAATDYMILVLKATALLSEQERRFIREIAVHEFGLERVAILVNQMDLVATDEHASVLELLRAFLGPFESQPLILQVSAAQALQGLEGGDMVASSGYDALMSLVRENLVERHRVLKSAAIHQAAEVCLAALTEVATRQHAAVMTSEADLKELIARLDPESRWFQERIERTQHRIEAFITTMTKEQFLREIEGFTSVLSEQLPNELMPVKDITTIKRHLPGYVETLWKEFFEHHLIPVRNRLNDEMTLVSEVIEEDLKALLGERATSFQEALGSFDPVPDYLKAFLMPSRGHSQAGATATWLQVGGLWFFIINPQLSLGLIGVGQAVRFIFKNDITTADKQAVAASLLDGLHELDRQIKQQVEIRFEALANDLQKAVAERYEQGLMLMRTNLESSMTHHQDLVARKEQIHTVLEITIPALRQSLDSLVEGAQTR